MINNDAWSFFGLEMGMNGNLFPGAQRREWGKIHKNYWILLIIIPTPHIPCLKRTSKKNMSKKEMERRWKKSTYLEICRTILWKKWNYPDRCTPSRIFSSDWIKAARRCQVQPSLASGRTTPASPSRSAGAEAGFWEHLYMICIWFMYDMHEELSGVVLFYSRIYSRIYDELCICLLTWFNLK